MPWGKAKSPSGISATMGEDAAGSTITSDPTAAFDT